MFRCPGGFCIIKPDLFIMLFGAAECFTSVMWHYIYLISNSKFMFALGLTFDFFADQKKEAMATDGGKASGGEGGTKGKSSGSQVSEM